jgi:hypothetical protein
MTYYPDYITEEWGRELTLTCFKDTPGQMGPYPAEATVCHKCEGRTLLFHGDDEDDDKLIAEMHGVYSIECPVCCGRGLLLRPKTAAGHYAIATAQRIRKEKT